MIFTRQTMMASVAAAIISAEVSAQATLEEVVVTARMRSETLAESPVSVKAFTESDIRSSGIQTPQDFVDLT
ncbi:MAG: hypothetical protein VW039_10885, partial [Halieaceae bacterium]